MRQRVLYYGDAIHWTFNGKYHRNGDLPARYYFLNQKLTYIYYSQHDNVHRTTGPAYINYIYKIKEYWYQDRCYDSLEEMQMVEACR